MIYVVGIGPGSADLMTFEAKEAIRRSEVIVGYKTYVDLITDLIEGKEVISNGMKQEVERCEEAVRIAKSGKTVAVISSGDAGVYGMAGLILELAEEGIKVKVVAGVTASLAAAALLGAPLMHDFCHISLSDLLTPKERIDKRVHLAAEGDFVLCFYNPRSKGRENHLREAFETIRKYRKADTPVGVVRQAGRAEEEFFVTTLAEMDFERVDMFSIVIVGNSSTFVKGGRMVTPRGYRL
ncbi:MAG: precorrin-3B C(17)-methyltransferase [Peptostreptococcaceae bacterium]|nr:precorrin-3B C(17)-methyltransferase [Peptostreptococcaceae bacterium]